MGYTNLQRNHISIYNVMKKKCITKKTEKKSVFHSLSYTWLKCIGTEKIFYSTK